MGWVCSKDGKTNADDVSVCPVCGTARPCRVVLAGAVGKIELLLGASVGAALLAEVVGEDAKYCKNPQYRIDCGDDNVWRVFPAVEATANATVVNGVEVAEGGIPLKSGDVIAVASRNDLSKTAAAVAVELVLL